MNLSPRQRSPRQLNTQRALGLRSPELLEDFFTQYFFRDAHTDFRNGSRLLSFLDVTANIFAQVEKTQLAASGDVLEVRMFVGYLRSAGLEEAEVSGPGHRR